MNKANLDFDKHFVIALVCAKYLKLITLEEKIASVQKLPLCLPMFFAFSSKILNSGIKICFDGDVFQDVACEECFSMSSLSSPLVFVTVFMTVLSIKLF